MARYAMVIDMQLCTGCGGCIIGCMNENNLPEGMRWSGKITETLGRYPNTRYHYRPTLCNHCENAPCVHGCPTKSLYKAEGGITAHDINKCIGCRYCMFNCPYEGVIFYNLRQPHAEWRNDTVVIPGSTSTPAETLRRAGARGWPIYNPDPGITYASIRPRGVVEKCNFCQHRVINGELPYCVEVCPSKARTFGDLDDPQSKASQLLGMYPAERLREELGTKPRVYYIREFCPQPQPRAG
ncbi:4Fe-4S dicluster domain-containing protein [Desulfonatronum thioautotrophicum]|uniref:4Fe-4S dicluster domain-containing protein n=1 Tax=Desulfonatronum thioautotrophicum TaxID=617001 RepID=UPI0005EBD4EE|nr:4Fe-4S dicluster domain-containing protein [Desulfonatronum thioautotrophicum]